MGFRSILAACFFWSCTPSTESEPGIDFQNLAGAWVASEDASLVLNLERACCGSRPKLEGFLSRGGDRIALDPVSYATTYPIQLPDSVGSREYAFEITLTTPLDPICAVDGFVEDRSGRRTFTQPALPDSAVLALTFSSRTAQGCDSLWTTMRFERRP